VSLPASLPARLAVALVLLLLGAVVGGCAIALHARWWGLALAVAATLATLVALPGGWWARLPFALGFVAALAALSGQRPEGDYLVASDVPGYVLLGFGVVVVCGGIVGLRHHPRTPDDAERAEPAP
jgi:hypothetical protein